MRTPSLLVRRCHVVASVVEPYIPQGNRRKNPNVGFLRNEVLQDSPMSQMGQNYTF